MVDLGALGDKAKDAAGSEKGEHASDTAIDKAGDATRSATGGKFDDKIAAGEDAADGKVGQ